MKASQSTLLELGYILSADCRVFEGLIGPWVHVSMSSMTREALKCQTQGRHRRKARKLREAEGPCRVPPTKPYGGAERGDVIGLR